MKRILAWALLLCLTVGLFAGCKKAETTPEPTEGTYITAEAAMEYLKVLYKTADEALKTPRDYERYGVIRVGGEPFTVVWTVEGADDMVKVVTGDGEMVTIDVDEQCQEDTPYTLTATITDQGGNSVSYSWNCILPKAMDVGQVLKDASALADGESLSYFATLTGKVTKFKEAYTTEYGNMSVYVDLPNGQNILFYRFKSGAADASKVRVGDTITVRGVITNYKGNPQFDSGSTLQKRVSGGGTVKPESSDAAAILADANLLESGEKLDYYANMTGKVTKIGSPYDKEYGNITV